MTTEKGESSSMSELIDKLSASREGHSSPEAKKRLQQYGYNGLSKAKGHKKGLLDVPSGQDR
jgi:hypothetical protein